MFEIAQDRYSLGKKAQNGIRFIFTSKHEKTKTTLVDNKLSNFDARSLPRITKTMVPPSER